MITMRCIGQSVGTETELRNQLRPLVSMETPSRPLSIRSLSFLDAVRNFAGPLDYESVYMKAKSDYVLAPLSTNAIQAMMAATAAATGIVLLCDAYGGKIADMAADATAFPRRAGTQYCIQYYASWLSASATAARLAAGWDAYPRAAHRPAGSDAYRRGARRPLATAPDARPADA